MRIQASAGPDKKRDLRDFCYKVTFTVSGPFSEEEGRFLSKLYCAVARGDKVRISKPKKLIGGPQT